MAYLAFGHTLHGPGSLACSRQASLGKMHKVVALLVLSEHYGCPWLEGDQEHTRLYRKQIAISNRTALTAWRKRSPNRPSPGFLGGFALLEPTVTGCSPGLGPTCGAGAGAHPQQPSRHTAGQPTSPPSCLLHSRGGTLAFCSSSIKLR